MSQVNVYVYVRNRGHGNEGGGGRGGSGGGRNNLSKGELSGRDIAHVTRPQMALTYCPLLVILVGTRACRQRGAVTECTDNWAT